MDNMRKQSLKSWVRIETKTVESVDFSSYPYKVYPQGSQEPIEAKTVIISTWATAKRLGLPWEETYRQNGISACAVCDGALPIFRNKHLVVIWWGDSACEEANFLTKFASKVTMLVRSDTMKASKVMQERALNNPKIEVMRHTEWKEVVGADGLMTWIIVVNNQTQEETHLEAWGLFYAIGHTPATAFLQGQVALDETWYIRIVPWTTKVCRAIQVHETPHGTTYTYDILPWVYAAWDVQDKLYRQAITSAWTWCMAALEAEHFLQG